jgi:phage FluMu protein Com
MAATNKVNTWLQAHGAEHKMRFKEVTKWGRRAWNIDCDACDTQLSEVGCMSRLEKHLMSAKHVNALAAGVVIRGKHSVERWLQAHAPEHKMRYQEGVGKEGRRLWNIDCDACGSQLTGVGCMLALELHLKCAKHVNALSAGEDPATRVVALRKVAKHALDTWQQAHAAEHRMRFAEVVNKRGERAWNIDCEACGTQLSKVGGIGDLMKHVKSTKHVNALSAVEDPATRVVLPRTKRHKVADWLQAHAAAHRMRFEEVVNKRGQRAWNIDCDACGTQLSLVTGIAKLEQHTTAKHINALSAGEDPATRVNSAAGARERKRPRS